MVRYPVVKSAAGGCIKAPVKSFLVMSTLYSNNLLLVFNSEIYHHLKIFAVKNVKILSFLFSMLFDTYHAAAV